MINVQKYSYLLLKQTYLYQLIFLTLLINFVSIFTFGQKDTIYTIDKSINTIGKFYAKDSIFNDLKAKKTHLFGDAKLEYEDIKLSAAYIVFDMDKKEVFASYILKPDGTRIGEPVMIQNGEEIRAGTLRFNLDTKKGYIQEVAIKQEETYLQMEIAKRQPNQEIHFRDGKFTTCDLKDPHFHFHLSKAILIPEKKIISKRMNLYVRDLSTPLGLPFLVIPQSKKKAKMQKHGLLFPKISPTSSFGMGISDLGYYYPFNDSIHTTFLGNFYTSGSWLLSNQTAYKVKYAYSGNLYLSYQENNSGFPDHTKSDKFTITWTHNKDSKANPYWNFSSNVNFISDNNAKNIVNPINPNYFSNSFKSDINLSRNFPNKPISMGIKLSTNQNTSTHTMNITSPIFTTNITRFSPTKLLIKNRIGNDKWYDQIGITYNAEIKNTSSFNDRLIKHKDYDSIRQNFINGATQNARLTTTLKIFKKTWSLTPSLNYSNFINFQQTKLSYDTTKHTLIKEISQNTGSFQSFSTSISVTSQIYTYYKFIGKNKPLLRHILTPSFSYNYTPSINSKIESYVNDKNKIILYSPYINSAYTQNNIYGSSSISFSFTNTLELKRKSDKDTITGFKKTKIIDALTLNGNYDFFKDSMKLSNLTLSLRINPINSISFVANSTFSPYAWDPTTKETMKNFAIEQNHSLGRFLNTNFNTTLTLTSVAGKRKIEQNKDAFTGIWNSEFRYFALHPEQYLDFEIPWKVNFTHVLSFDTKTNRINTTDPFYNISHTIYANGDVNITKLWKISNTTNFDFKTNKITNSNITLTRNLHCWNLSFWVTPIGTNKSFLVRFSANAQMLQDAKLELRKPPSVF